EQGFAVGAYEPRIVWVSVKQRTGGGDEYLRLQGKGNGFGNTAQLGYFIFNAVGQLLGGFIQQRDDVVYTVVYGVTGYLYLLHARRDRKVLAYQWYRAIHPEKVIVVVRLQKLHFCTPAHLFPRFHI